MRLPEEPDSSPQINIVPMIDIIFVVLIFFILSSLFLTPTEQLPVNLPEAATAESQLDQQHTIRVTVTVTGELRLGNRVTNLESLPEQITSRRIGEQPIIVIIEADEAVSHGNVVALMDRLRAIPDIQIGIATEP
ncbi:MAG: biopolymer transporter ExbD [Cyanobacteria bacterium P01_H01_bin.58]